MFCRFIGEVVSACEIIVVYILASNSFQIVCTDWQILKPGIVYLSISISFEEVLYHYFFVIDFVNVWFFFFFLLFTLKCAYQ